MKDKKSKTDGVDIFRHEMGDITPIKADNRVSLKPPPRQARQHTELIETETAEDFFSDVPIYEDCPDILSFAHSGLQHAIVKRLRQGRLPVENSLDLHGLTVTQARKVLINFLHDCEIMQLRHVIIIHGKGYRSKTKPVIKPMINRWLRVAPGILAFHSALPEDGGSGAVYVLLKKQK